MAAVKPDAEIVTVVPTAAEVGEKLVIVGACAQAEFALAKSRQDTSRSQTKAGVFKRTLAHKAADRGNIVSSFR